MPKVQPQYKEYIMKLDRLPSEERHREKIRETFDAIARFYQFEKMTPAIIEDYKTFQPLVKAGFFDERKPVVCKNKQGDDIVLRPSGALSIARAYVPHRMNDLPHPLKLFFAGDVFFFDAEKMPEMHVRSEWNLVMIGEKCSVAEAEMIQVVSRAFGEFGARASDIQLRVNAIGCSECRPGFRSAFTSYVRSRVPRLCKSCKRFAKKTPTQILKCIEEKCRATAANAPQAFDYICDECRKHLRNFFEFLDEARISYFLDSKLFREGSWYERIVFEFVCARSRKKKFAEEEKDFSRDEAPEDTAAEDIVVGEGGRVSSAGRLLAGRHLDIASVSLSLDDARACFEGDRKLEDAHSPSVFLIQLGELAKRKSLPLLEELRAGEIAVQESLGRDSIKSQLNVAERTGAEIALILGQKEALDETIIVRELQSGIQETIPQEKLIEFLKKKLKK